MTRTSGPARGAGRGGRPRVRRRSLGFVLVDVNERRGSLATVYSDRGAALSRRAGVDAAELLGRAIAHEIGHLLLGTDRHGSRGLMRASWSGADLRRNLATDWLLLNKEPPWSTRLSSAVCSFSKVFDSRHLPLCVMRTGSSQPTLGLGGPRGAFGAANAHGTHCPRVRLCGRRRR